MVFIGDYFALGLILVLCLFYFEQNKLLTLASRWFSACLVLTACTILLDLVTGLFLALPIVPLWLDMLVNSLYFLVNILTTTSIAMFLFCKILEHVYDPHCMKNAIRAMSITLSVYCLFVFLNLFTGWLFYYDESNNYTRGPLNNLGYITTIVQMFFVIVCYVRNIKSTSRSMRNALIQTFPIGLVCIGIQRTYPEIMLNGLLLAMADLVLFLNFQGQRQGVHNLTKLNNRSLFFSDLQDQIDGNRSFQLFMVNLKNYGAINQKYGHKIGDEILYQFAFSLEKKLPKCAAYHMNGTVFVLLLPYTNEKQSRANAEKLYRHLVEGLLFMDECIHTNFVMVDYIHNSTQEDATEIYKRLEYAAKWAIAQKLHSIRWDETLSQQMYRELYLIERMQTIDRAHGFEVWYQPIYCMHTERFCSAEVLLRLFEPDGSSISPAEFIPLAEQTGLIKPITWFVLEEACKILSSTALPVKALSINVPMTHMLDKDFLPKLNTLVDSYGVDRSRIHLEFTERETLEDFKLINKVMTNIVNAGYKFYLDDFGTGYSNFSCILQLPFYGVKLDQSISVGQKDLEASNSLVSTLTTLLHSMNFLVITEGVETKEQLQAHRKHGVDRIQGYYYAKPMNEADIKAFYNI